MVVRAPPRASPARCRSRRLCRNLYKHAPSCARFPFVRYRRFPPSGSVVSRAAGVVVEAAWTRRRGGSPIRSDCSDGIQAIQGEEMEMQMAGGGQPHWLQRASERSGGSYPHEEVRRRCR